MNNLVKKRNELKIKFVDFWSEKSLFHLYIYKLLSPIYDLVESDNPDFLFYSCYGQEHKKYSCIKIFYTGENIRPNYFDCDFSMSFDYNEYGGRNIRLPLYVLYTDLNTLINREQIKVPKKNFCSMVVSNPNCVERNNLFDKLNQVIRVDSGGRYKNNIGKPVENKLEFIQNYRFCISFENTKQEGYTTEKIIHAFSARCIPIYWGNTKISEEFNNDAFINSADYGNILDLVNRIIDVNNDDKLYYQYVNAPVFHHDQLPYNLSDDYFRRFLIKILTKKTNYFKIRLRPFWYYLKQINQKIFCCIKSKIIYIYKIKI